MMGNHETLLHNGVEVPALAMISQLKLKFPNSPIEEQNIKIKIRPDKTKEQNWDGSWSQSYFDSAQSN